MIQLARKGAVVSVSLALCLAAAACSSSSSSSSASSSTSSPTSSSSSSSSSTTVSISVAQFDRTLLRDGGAEAARRRGQGQRGGHPAGHRLLHPVRRVRRAVPEPGAAPTAGLSSSQFTVQNALGSDATQLTDAQSAITKGASVLVVDPLDSGVGAHIESYAKSHGVAVIDYDRLTLGGTRAYYVSFNNVKVGTKSSARASCPASPPGASRKPNVIVMKGAPDRQQRDPVRPGLRRRARPVLLLRASTWTSASPPEPGTRRPR